MKKRILIAVVACAVIAAIAIGAAEFLTPSPTAVILSPFTEPSVTAYRTESDDSLFEMGKHGDGYLHGWPILAEQTVDSADARERIFSILRDRRNFGGVAHNCFWPGMGFTLRQGDVVVDVVICLKCHLAYFYDGRQLHQLTLSERGIEQLRIAYHELFPNVEEDTRSEMQNRRLHKRNNSSVNPPNFDL
jgi:hypothetical protein